jgi:type VI secretion system secreted protein Hcp
MASMKLKSVTAAAALAAGVLSAPSASAAVDMFLKVPTIPGESVDARHADEIDVLSWSWGLTTGGQKTSGACVGDLKLVKYIDSASSGFMIALTVGQNLGDVVLSVRKLGKGQQEFLIVTMHDVTVSTVTTALATDTVVPTENVSLSFGYADWSYSKQKADGSLESPVTARVYSSKRGCQ